MENRKPVTIKDIAAETGMSTFTVSLALRENPRVKLATRTLIQETAKQMGYRRNALFAALGAHSRRGVSATNGLTLAVLAQRTETEPARPDALHRLLLGLPGRADALGYCVEEHVLDETVSAVGLVRRLRARGVAGVLFTRILSAQPILAADWSTFAVVGLGQSRVALPVHTVREDLFPPAYAAVMRAWELGYRRIGYLARRHTPVPMIADHERMGGVLAALREIETRGGIVLPPLPVAGFSGSPGLTGWLKRWKPDALIGSFEADWAAVQKTGVRIPQEMGYISLIEHRCFSEDRLAGYSYDRRSLGRIAVEWVDQMLRQGEFGFPNEPRVQLISGQWIDGETLPDRSPHQKI